MPSEIILLLFVFCGVVSGLLGGLLGIGGGILTVPALFYLFQFSGLIQDQIMQVAISTSLATTFVTSAVSTGIQLRKKAIHFPVIRFLIPGLLFGCILGSIFVHYLPSYFLRRLFGVMAMGMGGYFFFPRFRFGSKPNRSLSYFGLLIGTLSSLFGIGGGTFTVPVLLGYEVPMKNAVATSSGSTLATAFLGSVTYLLIAWRNPELPHTFGYIEIPAFIAISLGSIVSTPLGVRLAHTLDTDQVKRIFAIFLSLTGLSMILF